MMDPEKTLFCEQFLEFLECSAHEQRFSLRHDALGVIAPGLADDDVRQGHEHEPVQCGQGDFGLAIGAGEVILQQTDLGRMQGEGAVVSVARSTAARNSVAETGLSR